MVRRTLIGGIALLMLIGSARLADAQVSVNIGINLPGVPQLMAVPATPGDVRAERWRELFLLRKPLLRICE